MPRTHASEVAAKVIGREIRRARAEHDISQAELARRLGVSPSYVSNLEAGRLNVTVGQLANVASAMKVALDIHLRTVERENVRLRGPRSPDGRFVQRARAR
jgi:transcriptional regulator with XRE-family HTH domain